ncbi:MAG: hypothetical protein M3334_08685 [Actinomycetota bacterium]|nr:hypothetical protein [Actinomycetota bacterium]
MGATNTTRWMGIGLLGLPLYGALTFWSSLDSQPDPSTQYDAWSRFVTTDHYLITHLFGSIGGAVLAILGVFALGTYLAGSRAGRLGLTAMVMTVVGQALGLTVGGASTFAAPEEGQAHLAGIEEYAKLNMEHPMLSDTAMMATFALAILLMFVGNVLLGVAVWRSGTLPKWAGAIWLASALLFYVMGAVLGMLTTGGSLVTQPVAASLMVISGAWIAWSVLRQPSTEAVGVGAQPRVQ